MTRLSPRAAPAARPLLCLTAAALAACSPDVIGSPPSPLDPVASPTLAVVADLATTQGFRKQVTVPGMREHQAAFQQIADANGGTRALGTPGYDASAQYVYDRMVAAGYDTRFQTFSFTFVGDRTPPTLAQVSPTAATYVNGVDFGTMSYSGSGDVTAPVVAVDLVVPVLAASQSTSGCEAADFAGFPAGSIALLQRGTCTFRDKVLNAIAAGAPGAIIFNDGAPGREGPIFGTLNAPALSVPVVQTTFALGNALRGGVLNGPTTIVARIRVDAVAETRTGRNVIAESRRGDPARVILVGGQLASAQSSPGINWSSGSAAALEIAEVFAAQERTPVNRLRFVWFGGGAGAAGEQTGSAYYAASLTTAEAEQIAAMLDFRLLGSPNFARFVYDGDNSQFSAPPAGPAGSGTIEQLFSEYFTGQSLASAPEDLGTSTDMGPFLARGIPAGGVTGGAGNPKTAALAALFGGTADVPFDPCAGEPCDTFANVSLTALDQLSDAAAHAVLLLSRRNFAKNPL